MLIFEEKFTNKRNFIVSRNVIIFLHTVFIFIPIIIYTIILEFNKSIYLIIMVILTILFDIYTIKKMKTKSIRRNIRFDTDGDIIKVLMDNKLVVKLNLPISIQKGAGLETYFTNGSMIVRRLFVTDGQAILIIGEETKSSTMYNFDSKPKPSDLFAQNPGTLDKLEIVLSKYMRTNQNIAESSSKYENLNP